MRFSSSIDMLTEAFILANIAHTGQQRKGVDQSPYINHPINVMDLIKTSLENLIDNEEYDPIITKILVVGLLHDVIEDTTSTYQDIFVYMGKEIADYVNECSDDKSLPKEVRKKLQIENAASLSDVATIVKLADKIDNIEDLIENTIEEWSNERIIEYFHWSKSFVDQIRNKIEHHHLKIGSDFRYSIDSLIKLFDDAYKRGKELYNFT